MAQSALSFVDPTACCYKNTDNYKYSPFSSANEAIISSYESHKWEMNLTSWVGNWIEARNQVEIQITPLTLIGTCESDFHNGKIFWEH